jgi:hypothetical protein
MPRFFVFGIYLLLVLSGDGVWIGWNRFLHGGSIEDEDDSSILTDMTTWSLLFPDNDIKAEMMSPPWNNFVRSLLRFIVVRSGHDKGPGRIRFRSVFLILLWWQKEKEGRH